MSLAFILEACTFISLGAERFVSGFPPQLTGILAILTGVLLLLGK